MNKQTPGNIVKQNNINGLAKCGYYWALTERRCVSEERQRKEAFANLTTIGSTTASLVYNNSTKTSQLYICGHSLNAFWNILLSNNETVH